MDKITFRSDDLAPHCDDRTMFSRWRDLCEELFCSFDMVRPDDRAFSAQFVYRPMGRVGINHFEGTLNKVGRTRREVADGADGFCFLFNDAPEPMTLFQNRRAIVLDHGMAGLLVHSDVGGVDGPARGRWLTLNVSRQALLERARGIEDRLARPLDRGSEALAHLRSYARLLLESGAGCVDPILRERIDTMLLDLIVLALDAEGEEAVSARGRGLRMARLQQVLAAMKARFADPTLSAQQVANRLGLSRRYVDDLLAETGASFSERILELRLQKARALLTDSGSDRLRVSDIAYACGFNSVSYFNRRFRARFGAAPSAYRGAGTDLT